MFSKLPLSSYVMVGLAMLISLHIEVSTTHGQASSLPHVELMPFAENPVLSSESSTETYWDPSVTYTDGMFHMFYLVSHGNVSNEVYYATSEDGLHWTPYGDEPIFVADETLAPNGVNTARVFLDGDVWRMYLSLTNSLPSSIALVTASAPTGPWVVETPPELAGGSTGEWDAGDILVTSFIRTNTGFAAYYNPLTSRVSIGMATSLDGIEWAKNDNWATTDASHVTSDPVLNWNEDGNAWDSGEVAHPIVRLSENGWEMFYTATHSVGCCYEMGYAISEDGITWIRGDAPVLTLENGVVWPTSLAVVDDIYYVYYGYFTYSGGRIYMGVATGSVSRSEN